MEDVKKVKCSKCGFVNIYGAKKCAICNNGLKVDLKSCPKCAKRNSLEVKKCVSCGFKFSRQRGAKKNFLISLIGTLLLMGILVLLVVLNKSGVVTNINKIFKIMAAILVVVLLVTSINYNSKDKINYTAESEMISNNKVTNKMKKFSNLVIIIGSIVVLILLIYFYLHK